MKLPTQDVTPAGLRIPAGSLYTGLSEEMLKKLLREGKLDSVKIGRARVLRRADLDKLLAVGVA